MNEKTEAPKDMQRHKNEWISDIKNSQIQHDTKFLTRAPSKKLRQVQRKNFSQTNENKQAAFKSVVDIPSDYNIENPHYKSIRSQFYKYDKDDSTMMAYDTISPNESESNDAYIKEWTNENKKNQFLCHNCGVQIYIKKRKPINAWEDAREYIPLKKLPINILPKTKVNVETKDLTNGNNGSTKKPKNPQDIDSSIKWADNIFKRKQTCESQHKLSSYGYDTQGKSQVSSAGRSYNDWQVPKNTRLFQDTKAWRLEADNKKLGRDDPEKLNVGSLTHKNKNNYTAEKYHSKFSTTDNVKPLIKSSQIGLDHTEAGSKKFGQDISEQCNVSSLISKNKKNSTSVEVHESEFHKENQLTESSQKVITQQLETTTEYQEKNYNFTDSIHRTLQKLIHTSQNSTKYTNSLRYSKIKSQTSGFFPLSPLTVKFFNRFERYRNINKNNTPKITTTR